MLKRRRGGVRLLARERGNGVWNDAEQEDEK